MFFPIAFYNVVGEEVINMTKYSLTCSCGHTYSVDAENRDEAVAKLQEMMDEATIKDHMESMHPGEPAMSKADVDAMIAKDVVEAAAS